MNSIPSSFCSTIRAAAFPRVFSMLRTRKWSLPLCGVLGAMLCGAWSASSAQTATATSTTLTVTSDGSAATTVNSGSVVTLTASVTAGTTPLTTGQVNFCDSSAKSCTDIHLLGTAQLIQTGPSARSATLKFRPGIGSHGYKAVFAGTKTYLVSASSAASLTVTGALYPSTTTIVQSGSASDYMLTATVAGPGLLSPTGNVSFLDTSSANAVLWTEALGGGQTTLSWLNPQSPATTVGAETIVVGILMETVYRI